MEDKDRAIGFLFSDIARFRGILFDQLMQKHGLTHAQAFALNQLMLEDGLTQTQMSVGMKVGTVTVSGLVDRLEARGWVKRITDQRDRRAKKVWLCEKAAPLQAEIVLQFSRLNDISLDGLESEDAVKLVQLLRKVKRNLSEALKEGPKPSNKIKT
ncbi:MAG: MarR family transcriptional regulator for hemolysin [Paracoccaceae bacterium]|jgi:MarR family transcriptional regulator for hemolysin